MKKCPYCAEEIQDEAIKCKHCGEMFTESPIMHAKYHIDTEQLILYALSFSFVGLIIGILLSHFIFGHEYDLFAILFGRQEETLEQMASKLLGIDNIRENILLGGGAGLFLGAVLGAISSVFQKATPSPVKVKRFLLQSGIFLFVILLLYSSFQATLHQLPLDAFNKGIVLLFYLSCLGALISGWYLFFIISKFE